ncbi:MAG TPA: carboxymuconolactone decarboxylase family protein [Bacteroidales bacterium]|nr:carboxymuconolactone decarboxylase family protein [Bacteroidales bacterium]
MKKHFNKKIFTFGLLLNDIGFLIIKMPQIFRIRHSKKFTRSFIEKIMNVATAVNGCVYCEWFHAKQALACGITKDEIKNIMNLQFHADATDYELTALLFTQHYAETNRKPDEEMLKKFIDYYGEKTSKQIMLIIRMIFFGNLYGNTWDAVISRYKGVPAKGSNIIFEMFYFITNFWIMFPLMLIINHKQISS